MLLPLNINRVEENCRHRGKKVVKLTGNKLMTIIDDFIYHLKIFIIS